MIVSTLSRLKVVDGLSLPRAYRAALKPDAVEVDAHGRRHRLPRFFVEVDSWQTARETEAAPNFGLYEFINTDVREAAILRSFPRYVPLALFHLAAHLSVLRSYVGTYVHVAANGGYRSPSHGVSKSASAHHWGTAANVYRIGDDYLNTPEAVGRYADIVERLLPAAWTRPYGVEPGATSDHLHIDLGRYCVVPRGPDTAEDGSS